jgi:hypothetical protein
VQANHDEHDSHGHGAHEHGHGHLNLVLDGNQLMIELQAPAADLVGFEHAAKSDEEKAQYAKAMAQLKQPDALRPGRRLQAASRAAGRQGRS